MKYINKKGFLEQIRLVLVFLCCIVLAVNAGFLARTNMLKNQENFNCPSYMLIGENKNKYIIIKNNNSLLTSVDVHMPTHRHSHRHTQTHTHTDMSMPTHRHTHTYIHTQAQIHMCTHMHTH